MNGNPSSLVRSLSRGLVPGFFFKRPSTAPVRDLAPRLDERVHVLARLEQLFERAREP